MDDIRQYEQQANEETNKMVLANGAASSEGATPQESKQ